ncbi:MAG: prolipoprotein diacylglyceryl transferase [Nanoarchaeota archaeon]|nr:prolipoprotein diacylglyceryl transferase [Nanoarchaeota archaeon]
MFVHNINPVLFSIFGLEIRYYGLVYVLGFLVGLWYLMINREILGMSKDEVYDFIFYFMIGGILGARLFEVLFYNPGYYFSNLSQIIAIWNGGMSIHGGITGGIIVSLLFSHMKGIKFYKLVDILVIPLAFFLFLGRIMNYVNGELVGKITNLSWCVKFKNYDGCRHPSQIYEAFKNLILFFVLLYFKNKKLRDGALFWIFIILYSVLRFFVEFFKEPIALYLGLPLGQLFSLILIIVGVYFLWSKK